MAIESDISEWLEKAKEDLDVAQALYEKVFFGPAAFHCQQAAEKSPKAVYVSKFGELVKTHELCFLAEKVAMPKEMLSSCERLSSFFLNPRYPGFREKISHDDAEMALKDARGVFEWAKAILSKS